ncbi:MAG TPA: caspase family protein [Gaiellaceae bacterium]|jgi:hypothetical protein|nr:caspase family protein [Gaiellaceae bacterium]
MASWAVVVGIDRYWSDAASLKGAVRDALSMQEWLLDPSGGNVPADNLLLVLAPAKESPQLDDDLAWEQGTKANITIAINNLVQLSGGKGERLYFYYAGHGLTTRVSNRDESALLATDFTQVLTDNSIALRSLWEYFETLQFDDQFFFVDACRNEPPWGEDAFELGRWTLPRSRDPGAPPVQQFILYATSPKLKTVEDRGTPGEEHGVFTEALLDGLRGKGAAKAWSWDRRCYEVRWERLADYVKNRVEREQHQVAETPTGWLLQVPQDTGSRGVAGRERDALLTSFAPSAFPREQLDVLLEPDTAYPVADVRVLDAVGDAVAGQVGVAGTSLAFTVAPGTYGVRASAPKIGAGHLKAPVELYEPLDKPVKISLQPIEEGPEQVAAEEAGAVDKTTPQPVPIQAADPLSIVEVKDEAGRVVDVRRSARGLELPPGFYRVRHVGPSAASSGRSLVVEPGEKAKPVRLTAARPSPATLELLATMGGRPRGDNTVELEGLGRAAWVETSTLVAAALGRALNGGSGDSALGLRPFGRSRKGRTGIALYVVSEVGTLDPRKLELRVWAAGEEVPAEPKRARRLGGRLLELAVATGPGRHWVSVTRDGQGRPMVFAPTVLQDRVAAILLQITRGIRIFQYQPAAAGGPDTEPEALRRAEYLQRMLMSGRLDGAAELVGELATTEDPLLGCLCGYVLLRLGDQEGLAKVAERLVQAAPQLADGFVLRGEQAAAAKRPEAKQAFAEAAAAGIPLFAEGLTRLLEGVRANDIQHPGGAVVRYVFQNHMRGSMWSIFTPKRFEPGTRIITAADLGYEL